MSDTSAISKTSSFAYGRRRKYYRNRSSCCTRYWFHMTTTILLLIILSTSAVLTYILYKQAEKDRERRRIQEEFRKKYGIASKVLDLVNKDGIVAKWFKNNKNSIINILKQLITEMVQMIFDPI